MAKKKKAAKTKKKTTKKLTKKKSKRKTPIQIKQPVTDIRMRDIPEGAEIVEKDGEYYVKLRVGRKVEYRRPVQLGKGQTEEAKAILKQKMED